MFTSISGIGHTLGTSYPIEHASLKTSDDERLELLRRDGFDKYQLTDENIVELMTQSMRETIEGSRLDPLDIDAVMFSTESFWDAEIPGFLAVLPEYRRIRDGLLSNMQLLGLRSAYPYANWLSSCANLGPAIALARGLVESHHHERVMVVLGDKQYPDAGALMENGAAVFSDVAASCIIDKRAFGLRIEHVITHAATGLAAMRTSGDAASFVLETSRAVRALARKFRMRTGRGADTYGVVLTNNYHIHSLKIILDGLGISSEKVFRESRADLAHGHASDTLIGLKRLVEHDSLGDQDEVLLLMTGLYCWNLVVVKLKKAP